MTKVLLMHNNIVVFFADPEAESDGEGAADVEAAPKIKKKIVKGPAENKSKKEHINVVFIGHVGKITINSGFA